MEIDAKQVKRLRERSGVGMMDCKKALQEADGDEEKALANLREKGMAKAAKKATRKASEGIVDAYIHHGDKVGVLVELNCETDFVAKNDDFRELARNLCLQVAATNPAYLRKEDVPEEILEEEKDFLRRQALNEGKPEKVIDKIIEGRINKFYQENCLLEQPYVKDEEKTVNDLLIETVARLGENIILRRFARFEVGELSGEAEDEDQEEE